MRKNEFFEDEDFHVISEDLENFLEKRGICILIISFVLSIIHLL